MMRRLRVEIPCRMLAHIVSFHARAVSALGKKKLAYFCAVLRFSDPPYALLDMH